MIRGIARRAIHLASRPFAYLRFLRDFLRLRKDKTGRHLLRFGDTYPCLDDATAQTGFDRHYVFHPAWAARIIRKFGYKRHVDISSTLHFVSIVSAFVPVEFYDYRPANLRLSSLKEDAVDLLDLPFKDNSIQSLSCMHVVEHIGLGRYGDRLNIDGDLIAVRELRRVVAHGGSLLFVVPIAGVARVHFNAHRVYEHSQVVNLFPDFKLREFALIPDSPEDGGLVVSPSPDLIERQVYGCGCYHFVKVRGKAR